MHGRNDRRCACKNQLVAVVIAFSLCWSQAAKAQTAAADAVDELRQLLKAPVTDFAARELAVKDLCRQVEGINDLRRALILREWRDEDPEDRVAAADRHNRSDLAMRFEEAVRDVLGQGDTPSKLAVLNMLGKMGITARGVGAKNALTSTFAPEVAALVRQGSPSLRTSAARTLGQINPDPEVAGAALGGLLNAKEVPQRKAAAEGLVNLLKNVSQLAAHNRPSGEVETTRAEVVKMGRVIIPLAARCLHDADPVVRRYCVEAIEQAAAGLCKLVLEPNQTDTSEEWNAYQRQVEEERAELLPLIRTLREQGPTLTRTLGDADAEVRVMARKALEEMTSPQLRLIERAASVLTQGARTQPAGLKPQQFISPASHQDVLMEGLQGTVQALAAGLSDKDVRARRGALDVLEALGPAASVAAPALAKALGDSDPFIRWAAARTLGKISPVAAATVVPGLAGLLVDLDLDVRLAAATALEHYGPAAKGALPELTRAMRASDAELRVAAIEAVGAVGANEGRSAIPALIEALSDTDARVRQLAAKTLGKFGPVARSAVESLNQALEDSDPEVQNAASEALLSIKRPARK